MGNERLYPHIETQVKARREDWDQRSQVITKAIAILRTAVEQEGEDLEKITVDRFLELFPNTNAFLQKAGVRMSKRASNTEVFVRDVLKAAGKTNWPREPEKKPKPKQTTKKRRQSR